MIESRLAATEKQVSDLKGILNDELLGRGAVLALREAVARLETIVARWDDLPCRRDPVWHGLPRLPPAE